MKTTKEENGTQLMLIVLTIIFIICAYFTLPEANAQPTQNIQSEWVETNTIELPQGLEIFSGINRNGNPKYWFEIKGIKIFISPTNKEHYINNTCTILLVEWYNKNIDEYKYTTRQKKETKQVKRLNLNNLTCL